MRPLITVAGLLVLAGCTLAGSVLAGCATAAPAAPGPAATAPVTTGPAGTASPAPSAGSMVSAIVPPGSVTVGLGDSITYNSGSWFRRVCRTGLLGRCVNAGVRGDTTTKMLARLPRAVLARHPRTVLVMGGTNDIRRHETSRAAVARLERIVEAIRASGATAVLCAVPPSGDLFAENAQLNREIVAYAGRAGVPLLDLNGEVADAAGAWRPGLSPDGVHPSDPASALMAAAAQRALPALLGR